MTSRDVWVVLLNALAMLAALAMLWSARLVIGWIALALLLALAASPVVNALERRGVRRGLGVLIAFVVLGAVLSAMFAMLVPMLIEQGRALVARAPDLLEDVRNLPLVRWADERFDIIERLRQSLSSPVQAVAEPALAVAQSALVGIAGFITTLVLAIFILLFGRDVVEGMHAWLPPDRRSHWRKMAGRLRRVVGGYVLGTLLVASVGGLVMGTTLALLGVPYLLPLALVTWCWASSPSWGAPWPRRSSSG